MDNVILSVESFVWLSSVHLFIHVYLDENSEATFSAPKA